MPTSPQRMREIACFALNHGVEKAKEMFSVSEKSVRNALGWLRNSDERGQINQKKPKANPKDKILAKIGEKFTMDDLQMILASNVSERPYGPRELNFEGETINIGYITDTHIGSKFFREQDLVVAMNEMKKADCSMILHSGDVLEGMSGRPGQIYELDDVGYEAQIAHAVTFFNEHLTVPMYFITGNHDLWANSKSGVGIDVGADLERRCPKAHHLGIHQGELTVNGAKFMLWHGEDGSSYAHSYRPQKIVEAFSGGEKPNVLLCGHTHKQLYMFDRNIHVVSGGCIERQSNFMKNKRLPAHCGFWILSVTIGDSEIKKFSATWHPIYQ